MSGIFGIYQQDRRNVDLAQMTGLENSIVHRGPDGVKSLYLENIALGHAMLHTTPESLKEHLPYTDDESMLSITADARIDNREELAEKLSFGRIDAVPDSVLILEAFKQFGTDSFQMLNGDFSFVIWDPREQRLFCVRDYIGIKPFYYHNGPNSFIFSSEIQQLAKHPAIPLQVNERMVAEYLSYSFCSKTETLFSDISRLAPAHYLLVHPDKISSHQYWSWEPKKRLYYKNTAQYTEHFLEIFEHAVKNRLRSSSTISAELSGGLDSSSVVGMANRLLKQSNGKQLQLFSMTFPGLACDETEYIDAVAEYNQLPVSHVPYDNYIFLDWKEQTRETFEPPDYPNLTMSIPLLSMIRSSGSKVVLSGIGGDECFTGSGYPYLDYLRAAKVTGCLDELRFQAGRGLSRAAKRCLINVAWPLISPVIKKRLLKKSAKGHIPPWLSETFVNRTGLVERIVNTDSRLYLSNLGNTSLASIFTSAAEQFFLEQLDRQRALFGIENRYPFLDRKLMEFTLSIPDYERFRQGQIKQILRNPQNILIPESIRNRDTKAEFSSLFNVAFQKSLFLLPPDSYSLGSTDWLHSIALAETVKTRKESLKRNTSLSSQKTWELWFYFSINLWYNNVKYNVSKEEKR